MAALFAWHPAHVESVAWISERKDVLSTFFGLLSLLFYVRYAQKRSKVEGRGTRVESQSNDCRLPIEEGINTKEQSNEEEIVTG